MTRSTVVKLGVCLRELKPLTLNFRQIMLKKIEEDFDFAMTTIIESESNLIEEIC